MCEYVFVRLERCVDQLRKLVVVRLTVLAHRTIYYQTTKEKKQINYNMATKIDSVNLIFERTSLLQKLEQ